MPSKERRDADRERTEAKLAKSLCRDKKWGIKQLIKAETALYYGPRKAKEVLVRAKAVGPSSQTELFNDRIAEYERMTRSLT